MWLYNYVVIYVVLCGYICGYICGYMWLGSSSFIAHQQKCVTLKIFRALTSKWKQKTSVSNRQMSRSTLCKKNIKYSFITNVTGNFDPHIVITPLQDAASSQQSSWIIGVFLKECLRLRELGHQSIGHVFASSGNPSFLYSEMYSSWNIRWS